MDGRGHEEGPDIVNMQTRFKNMRQQMEQKRSDDITGIMRTLLCPWICASLAFMVVDICALLIGIVFLKNADCSTDRPTFNPATWMISGSCIKIVSKFVFCCQACRPKLDEIPSSLVGIVVCVMCMFDITWFIVGLLALTRNPSLSDACAPLFGMTIAYLVFVALGCCKNCLFGTLVTYTQYYHRHH